MGDPVEDREGKSIWVWIGLAAAASFVFVAATFLVVGWSYGLGWFPWNNPSSKRPKLDEGARTAVLFAGVVAGAIAGAVAVRRQRSTERAHDLDRRRVEIDEVSRLRDRYTSAAEQMGSETSSIRMAGVHALAALADDWMARAEPQEAQVCLDLLIAYVRSDEDRPGDAAVKASIFSCMRRRLAGPPTNILGVWSNLRFDFSDCVFSSGLNLSGTTFAGHLSFRGAEFTNGLVDFSGCRFLNDVDFTNVSLRKGSTLRFVRSLVANSFFAFTVSDIYGGLIDFSLVEIDKSTIEFDAASIFAEGRLVIRSASLKSSVISLHLAECRGKVLVKDLDIDDQSFIALDATFQSSMTGPWGAKAPHVWPLGRENDALFGLDGVE